MSRDTALLFGRVLLVAIFPISAYYKIIGWPMIVDILTKQGMPLALIGGYGAIAVELGCSALVVLGLLTRPAAVVLMLYTAATALIAHRFCELAGPAQFGQLMTFMKNVSMIGGLGIVAAFGPGRFALRP